MRINREFILCTCYSKNWSDNKCLNLRETRGWSFLQIILVFFLLQLLALSLYSILCISINIAWMNKSETVLESSGHVEECLMNIVYIQHSLLKDRLRRVKYSEI